MSTGVICLSWLGPVEARKNRWDKHLSGGVFLPFCSGRDWMTSEGPWQALCLWWWLCFLYHSVGLFVGKSSICWGRTSWDFRASPFEPELRVGINFLPFLPPRDNFSPCTPPTCTSCAQGTLFHCFFCIWFFMGLFHVWACLVLP